MAIGLFVASKKGEEVGYQRIGQLRMQEVPQDLIVAGIAQSYRIEIVAHHELVEDIGTEHHGLRNLHGGILILVELRMALDDVVEEAKTSALSAQRSLADAGKWAYLSNFIRSNTATTPMFFM